ncbi:MAG: carbon-nitrogen hydrolase family protein [Actinomycetes bacterium]
MRRPLIVAAAQPAIVAGEVERNAIAHAEMVRVADARVVVFPELSLTGYELGAEPVSPAYAGLSPVVEACAETGCVALVGAPVRDETGRDFIAMLRVEGTGAEVCYRKTWLAASEAERFSPGDAPGLLEVDGWRVGLGICKDTGAPRHVAATTALGVDAYFAGLVHRPEDLAEQEARGLVIARACRAWVVFASFAGPTGDGFTETAGTSTIWSPDGKVLARAGREVGGVARAVIG